MDRMILISLLLSVSRWTKFSPRGGAFTSPVGLLLFITKKRAGDLIITNPFLLNLYFTILPNGFVPLMHIRCLDNPITGD